MSGDKSKFSWHNKIINPAQIGGIETSVLDNGLAKGVRIAWVNTGTGLRYKVLIDRALDIAEAFYNQHSLAWLSYAGASLPKADAARDMEWLSSFGGGLVTTCGLAHIGGTEADEYGSRGVHGRISNTPALVESIIQPDITTGELDMSITATIKESSLGGPHLELKRSISSTLGQPAIRIHDVITNRGNEPAPHMCLYHCNFGWPLVDEGAHILWRGDQMNVGNDTDDLIFNEKNNFHQCLPPLGGHCGPRNAWAGMDVTPDKEGICTAGILNQPLGLGVVMRFKKTQLPWLTNWQHWGPGEYVTALEPGTHPPIGQAKARKEGTLIYIEPGQSRTHDLEITVITDTDEIQKLIAASENR